MTEPVKSLRADARRNHESLLGAAREVFVERGPDVALDEIARRAGVGIATLYRRFPDRLALMRAVVLDALEVTSSIAQAAIDDGPDPVTALSKYMHSVIEVGISAVIPTLLDHLDMFGPELRGPRQRSAALAQQLFDDAQACGAVRVDATFGDVGLMLVRIARRLPGPIDAATQRELAHRHVDLLLSGLLVDPRQVPLAGPALGLSDLESMNIRNRRSKRG
jgi:AcrR family transcriptional regulator